VDGEEKEARLESGDLDNAPWDDLGKDPPLSVRTAIDKAKSYAKSITKGDHLFDVGDVTLKKILSSKYVYIVELFAHSESGYSDGFLLPLNVVVLMDGSVVPLSSVTHKIKQ
jgi:hypothetical protein